MDSATVVTIAREPAPAANRLNSWKEISTYLGRTVRTVQRWERTCDLPVHRHRHSEASSVYAFRSELDAWWHSRGDIPPDPHAASGAGNGDVPTPRHHASPELPIEGAPTRPVPPLRRPRYCVGRESERRQLWSALEQVRAGSGLLVAIAGEAGIGKTTLVEDFLGIAEGCHPGRSRSAERLAGTETYLALLDALDDLLRRDAGGSLALALRTSAPLWHSQLAPAAGGEESAESGQPNGPQQRIKRELLAFLHQASRERPVVLFLDDLHWADRSTLDLLAYVANHLDGLRVLIVVSYRTEELQLHQQPFVAMTHDLTARGVYRTIEPRLLARQDIDQYLSLRLPGHDLPPAVGEALFDRTEGNPFFLVALVGDICDGGGVRLLDGTWRLTRPMHEIARELPESILGMVQRKIDRLPDADRRLLLAASVQGLEFTAAIVADAVGADAVDTEERLQRLRTVHGFLYRLAEVELPDGRLTVRFQFAHALYQERLRASLTPARLVALSRATAAALERTYAAQAQDIASRLAVLFETARDFRRAAECFLAATRRAVALFAYEDAILLGRRGLDAVAQLPDDEPRRRCELEILLAIALPMRIVRGLASPELPALYDRARTLCGLMGDSRELTDVVWGSGRRTAPASTSTPRSGRWRC